MKFYIETYGCQANKSDSEIITAILKSNHHQSTTDSSRAEIIILNTCYVKQSTQNRIINKLRQLQSQTTLNTQIQNKNTNKQEQYNPNKNKVKKCGALPSRLTTSKIIVVAGCMPEIEPKRIKQILPDAILVSPRQVHKIADAIRQKKSFLGKSRTNKSKLPKSPFPSITTPSQHTQQKPQPSHNANQNLQNADNPTCETQSCSSKVILTSQTHQRNATIHLKKDFNTNTNNQTSRTQTTTHTTRRQHSTQRKPQLSQNITSPHKKRITHIPAGQPYTIQISEGCTNQCSYCAAKLARGNIYSFPQKDITNELKSAIEKGYNIFYLTSQDTAAYGLDHSPKSQLPHLLTCLTKLPGNFQLRVGMMNPSNTLPVLKQLIQAFNSPKIKPFLHIPVQSGSDKILKHMNRKYTTRDFKKIVTCFRKKIPGIDISTDIIVGYPTETRSDFRKTLSLIKTIKPEVLNISRYSKRPHTPASITHPKQHPTQELKHRSRQLTNLYRNYHSRQ